MNCKYHLNVWLLILFSLLFFTSCKKEELKPDDNRLPFSKGLDPKLQVSELCRNLIIKGQNKTGVFPASNSSSLQITISQENASITNDNILFVPFVFAVSGTISGVYLQINGADNYWAIPALASNDNVYVASVGIPVRILNGSFVLKYKLYDAGGRTGNEKSMNVSIVSPQSFCGNNNVIPRVEGQDGLTVRTINMGDQPGKVKIAYNTYTVKDRIDIRYNNKWIRSTGALLDDNSTPPIRQCDRVGNGDGFVGSDGTFEFDYDPALSRKVDVYVSGCLDGGTQWYFDAFCPSSNGPVEKNWYDELPSCPCTYREAQDLANEEAPGKGKWKDYKSADPWYSIYDFHYGAHTEVRWLPAKKGNHGQQCTYDEKGSLITSGIAAGSPDFVSPNGWFGLPGDHWNADMSPWMEKPCIEYLKGWPSNNGNNCQKNPKSDIVQILDLVGDMTCKEIVLLFKSANDNFPVDPGGSLNDYLSGVNINAYPDKSKLIGDLKVWEKEISENLYPASDPSDNLDSYTRIQLLSIVRKAISNLGG